MSDATRDEETTETVRVLGLIYAAFGLDPLDDPATSSLLPLIKSGRILYDQSRDRVDYMLSAPLELKNKETLDCVSFREPTGAELEYIRQGIRAGGTELDLGQLVTMTLRSLIKTGPLSVAIAERLKARDVDALREVFLELGFFLR